MGPHQRPKEEECPRAARSASPDATVQQQPWGVDNQEAAGLEYLGASQGVLGHGFAFRDGPANGGFVCSGGPPDPQEGGGEEAWHRGQREAAGHPQGDGGGRTRRGGLFLPSFRQYPQNQRALVARVALAAGTLSLH